MTPAAAWLVLGALTSAVDGAMLWRRYTGRLGERVREECRAVFLRSPANVVAVVLIRDTSCPRPGWRPARPGTCGTGARREGRP